MTKDIELTIREWQIVQKQCSKCKFWNDSKGCQLDKEYDPRPIESCLRFPPDLLTTLGGR